MASEDYKESEMSKIVKRLMDEEGFEFGEAVREAMEQTKNFESKADGGSIGIEVLFKPKRQNFFMGGPALEGPSLNIYNSMKTYGATDQAIANAIKQAGYDLPTADSNTTSPDSTPDSSQPSGNDGRSTLPIGSSTGSGSGLIGDFMTATQERQNRLTNPNKATEFFNKFTGGGQRDIGEMIRTGEVDQRKLAGIPTIGNIIGKALPDSYYNMSLGDQVFTQAMSGYDGPTVFGENLGNQDPFGLNVRSGFGNYAEAVGEDFASLSESLTGRLAEKYGVEFDEETGMFTGKNLDAVKKANDRTKMMRTKFNFRKDQLAAKNRLDSQIKAAERQRQEAQRIQDELAAAAAAKSKAQALAAIQKQGRQDYNPNIHGQTNYGRDSQGNQSFDSGMGFGIGSDGGPVSNKTGKGRTGARDGGLATMFKEKR